jgi:preprotein translocase subunit SecB
MRTSPLQLSSYFVTEFSLTTNRRFDAQKSVRLHVDDLTAEPACMKSKKSPGEWQVTLQIRQKLAPNANTPYSFALEMVGFFRVHEKYPAERVEMLVRTNAPSVLFGMAREVIRGATCLGPFGPILLPTVSFYEPQQPGRIGEPKATYVAHGSSQPRRPRTRSK